jgi:CRISPR system Cascade subunit CasE
MTTELTPLHLVRVDLDARDLFDRLGRFAKAPESRALPPDLGYLVHCELVSLFDDLAPKPFIATAAGGRRVTVWGYCSASDRELSEHAATYRFPAPRLRGIEGATLPAALWRPGRIVGFETRVCPTQRMAKAGPAHRKGAEVDVFLARCREASDAPVDREGVYRDWLARQVTAGGAELKTAQMTGFRLSRVIRGGSTPDRPERLKAAVDRPDATFRGLLEIVDGEAFARLLARGLGRHRSFGFGMLRLVPPGATRC